MDATKQPDLEAQMRHFQSINAANVTNMVNVLLGLSVAVTAFAVNVLSTAQVLDHLARYWLVASLILLFTATFVGIIILFTRLEDYRRTIEGTSMMQKYPGVVTDELLIKKAIALKKTADRLNRWTNVLIYLQPALFMTGFVCLAVSVFITDGNKLVG